MIHVSGSKSAGPSDSKEPVSLFIVGSLQVSNTGNIHLENHLFGRDCTQFHKHTQLEQFDHIVLETDCFLL